MLSGGLHIYTELNPVIQDAIEEVYQDDTIFQQVSQINSFKAVQSSLILKRVELAHWLGEGETIRMDALIMLLS